jgi:hypothetical protein
VVQLDNEEPNGVHPVVIGAGGAFG